MLSLPKTIAIVGSGALGSYYGAKLARQGRDVRFLMRADLEAVRRAGLRVREGGGEWRLQPAQAFGTTAEIGPVDLVIIGLKTTANADLEPLIPPLLHEGTLLLTLQNGLGNEEFLADRWGTERVSGGLCFVCLNRVAPGVIEHYGHGTLSIGEFRRAPMERTRALGDMFSTAGIETHVVENLVTERWRKLVWNIPFNGLAIATGGRTCDTLLADEGLQAQVRALMAETIAAAAVLGHAIPADFMDLQIERTLPMGPYKPSSLIDWQAGRAVEVESIWGEPWRQGVGAGRVAAASGIALPSAPGGHHAAYMKLSLDADVLPKAVRDFHPEFGMVLGSGLGPLVEEVDAILSVPYDEIPGLPVSTVPGHAGRFVFGRLAGRRVVVAQGRVHLYEGCTAEEVTAGVRFMGNLGVKQLILTNAAGTLHPDFAPGEWMMLNDHLNLTGTTPLLGGANFVDMTEVYSVKWRSRFRTVATEEKIALHEGVYAGLLGPQYETPAEVRMFRVLGADAVGMSTVLEAIQARAMGMEVAGFSCLTNWAAGISGQSLDHHEVLETGRTAAEQMMRILRRALIA